MSSIVTDCSENRDGHVGATEEGVGRSTSATPATVGNTILTPPRLSPSSPAPAPTERVSRVSFASASWRDISYPRTRRVHGGGTLAAGGTPRDPRTTRRDAGGVAAMAGDREAAVEMYHQMQLSIAGGGGDAAGMATVTR